MRDLADAMKVPPQATQAIIGISMRGSLVRGNRLFADQRQEEIRATRAPRVRRSRDLLHSSRAGSRARGTATWAAGATSSRPA